MPIFKMQLGAEEEHIPLPESTDEDSDSASELSGDEHNIEDPFYEKRDIDASDSDDAPEVLTFRVAKKNRIVEKKKTIEVVKVLKEEKKRKRKELHDKYMKQKMEKRQNLLSKLLPEYVLEELQDQPKIKKQVHFEENNEEKKEDGKKDEKKTLTEEIIKEHGSTLFKCKSLTEEDKKQKILLKDVKTYKDRLLYSGRIRREKSNKDANAKRKKKLVVNVSKSNNPK